MQAQTKARGVTKLLQALLDCRPMPKPRIQILVCTNERPEGATKPSCGPKDALALYRAFKDGVRRYGLRQDVMVVRTGCLKHCSRGIVIALWPRNIWYQGVQASDVDEILRETIIAEREIPRLKMPDIPWE